MLRRFFIWISLMIVLVLIVGSSTCLALDHPLDPPTSLKAQVL